MEPMVTIPQSKFVEIVTALLDDGWGVPYHAHTLMLPFITQHCPKELLQRLNVNKGRVYFEEAADVDNTGTA